MESVVVFGKRVYPATSPDELLEFASGKKGILVALGAEKLLNKDPMFNDIVNRVGIGYCDGFAAQYAVTHRGYPKAAKIRGAKLWLELIRYFPGTTRYYILGAKQEVLDDTLRKLKDDFPGICIAGARNGYFDASQEEEILKEIRDVKADVVFVALGSPKQEFLMKRFLEKFPALYMGLGGSFDLYTGRVQDVPQWWVKIFKWEGLYRSFYDFRNLKRWKRQFVVLKICHYFLIGDY